jgi:hypothetical protein
MVWMDIEMICGWKDACYIGTLEEYGWSHGRGKTGRTSTVSIGHKHSKMDIFRSSSHSHLPYLWMGKFPQTFLHNWHYVPCTTSVPACLSPWRQEAVWSSKPSEQSTVHDGCKNPKHKPSFGPLWKPPTWGATVSVLHSTVHTLSSSSTKNSVNWTQEYVTPTVVKVNIFTLLPL